MEIKLIVTKDGHYLQINEEGQVFNTEKVVYSFPLFFEYKGTFYTYLSPYWGDERSGVYALDKMLDENKLEIVDNSLTE